MAESGFIPAGTVEHREMLDGVFLRTLGTTDDLMLVEVTLKKDAVVPMHSHPHHQVGYVISGEIELIIDGVTRNCTAGDSYYIPGGVEHQGRGVTECVVIDVFNPPREDYR